MKQELNRLQARRRAAAFETPAGTRTAKLIHHTQGVASGALALAFDAVRGTYGFDIIDGFLEPRFSADGGCAFLSRKDARLQMSWDRRTGELCISCYGQLTWRERDAIARTLRGLAYPVDEPLAP